MAARRHENCIVNNSYASGETGCDVSLNRSARRRLPQTAIM